MSAEQARRGFKVSEVDALCKENNRLREALEEYADHQSWRCTYRARYGECCCGLDETMQSFGLPVVVVQDPEAKERSED